MNKAHLQLSRKTRLLRAVGRGLNTPAEIAESMGINRVHVATALHEFAEAGLVDVTTTRDIYRIAYSLTEQGREAARA